MAATNQFIRFYLWITAAYLALGIALDFASYPGPMWARVLNQTWRAGFTLVMNVFLLELAIPWTARRKRLIQVVLSSLLLLVVVVFLSSFGWHYWKHVGVFLHLYIPLRTFSTLYEAVMYGFSYTIFSVVFYGVAKHLHDHVKLKHTAQQLLIDKQQAELNYLKSQTNPHFLFNTLNSIYSLATDKSNLAPEAIVRLSNILRFMLYEASGSTIRINQELRIIQDYVALEQLRYDESLRVTVKVDVEDLDQQLPPLLLIPIVENAFKHGVSETRGRAFVEIHAAVRDSRLTFTVRNSVERHGEGALTKDGLGLSNLRRQLELLFEKYELNQQHDDNTFTSTLIIDLSRDV